MRFLLVYPAFGILGGIETLIVRMSRWLVANGHEVTVLIETYRNLGDLLPSQARCIVPEGGFKELFYYFHAARLQKTLALGRPDVIMSFDVPSSWIACQLATISGGDCKVIAEICNPNTFRVQYATENLAFWNVKSLHLKNFLENIPANARLFCWAEDLEEFQDVHHQQGVVWPLPIDSGQFYPGRRRAKWGKIVSVGRLSSMKEYNLYMIEVVRDLIVRGYNVSWSVYGAGPYETEMRERIKEYDLEDAVEINGFLPEDRVSQAIEDAYVFVGMGTTILEASFMGVPNVVAIPYDRTGLTGGPIYRHRPGSGWQPNATLKVTDEVERLLLLSPSEYAAEQDRVRSHVRIHEIAAAMGQLLELISQAKPSAQNVPLYLANYPLYFIRALRQGLGASPA